MEKDKFVSCLEEAEILAEEHGSSYGDKLVLGLYRNYSFESHYDLLIDRIMASNYDIIKNHYWRYLGPVIQCDKTTSNLIKLLRNEDYFDYTSSITSALLTKDLTSYEKEIFDAMVHFSGKEDYIDHFISICKLIRRDTEVSFRELLLKNFHQGTNHFDNHDFFEALGFQLTVSDIVNLPEMFEEELETSARWRKTEHLNFTKTAAILVERFLDNDSLNLIHHWMKDKILQKTCVLIFRKLGNNKTLTMIQTFVNESEKELCYLAKSAISLMSYRTGTFKSDKIQIEKLKNHEKILLKGGISGVSTTKFFGYYTGIDKKKILTAKERRKILTKIFLTDLVFSNNDMSISTPYLHGTSYDKRTRGLQVILGNLETRQTFAAKNVRQRPWHPQGLYTYGILSEDAKWLADTYGKELGIYVCKIPTNVPGVFSLKIYNLNSRCNSCEGAKNLFENEKLTCFECGLNICDSNNRVELEGAIRSNFSRGKKNSDKYYYEERELSEKELEAMYAAYPIIIENAIPQFSNHLAAIYADIEEMAGISGDPRKRMGLD